VSVEICNALRLLPGHYAAGANEREQNKGCVPEQFSILIDRTLSITI
jgi:hypothetical protein